MVRLNDVIGQTSTCKAHDTCPTSEAISHSHRRCAPGEVWASAAVRREKKRIKLAMMAMALHVTPAMDS